MDKSWRVYQLPMDPKSQQYTTYSAPFGAIKWLRMPIGFTGSPNTFQSLMEHVLVGLTGNITVPFLDDCIIFRKTLEEYNRSNKRLQQVFRRLLQGNLTINPRKCAFFQTKVLSIRHVISKNGLEAKPEKSKQFKTFQYHSIKQMLSRSEDCVHNIDGILKTSP